ncbi:5'/3'-nucleotidase SurE [Peptoniphilus catoniae]|uniref:5'/3'-nucleotidase SurE n=1 Tax=Peptoniphilus catoniae TaxID=1660341 RepID=UPI0010FEDB6F|nr:5'/3'-nucleotidase SurE [Peptoniphilus catoniae]
MKILLTNDDGFFAPGIKAMAKALLAEGHEVIMVAPEFENSGKSHSITLMEELVVHPVKIKDLDCECYSVSGTPADSVRAALKLFDSFDYCFSGVNLGYNAGMDILYSGTVSAAIEANVFGLNSIAISAQYAREKTKFSSAAKIAIEVFNKLHNKLDRLQVLNINVPNLKYEDLKGVKVCMIGGSVPDNYKITKNDDSYLLKLGPRPDEDDIPSSDRFYLSKGYATLTPLVYDLNNKKLIEKLSDEI